MNKTTLGIIGGGQLGSLLASAAKKIDIKTIIFCDDINAPGQKFSDGFIFSDYHNEKKSLYNTDLHDCIQYDFYIWKWGNKNSHDMFVEWNQDTDI